MKRTTKTAWMAALAAILVQTASAQTGQDPLAAFRFVNRSGADIQVRATGGFEREFLVDDGGAVVQGVAAGSATEIAYWPPWGDGYLETEVNPRHLALRAPVAGMTNDVALTLARRTDAPAAAPGEPIPVAKVPVGGAAAMLRFHNPLDALVRVETSGGLSGVFEVAPGAAMVRVVQAGVATICRYHAPYSGLYAETAETPREVNVRPSVGEEIDVELVLLPKTLPAAHAVLRLGNPNDADVVAVLSGGLEDEVLVEAGATKEVTVRPGVETVLRYHATKQQYAENSPETAMARNVTPKGGEMVAVDLKLTKRAYPVVQLVNGGDVALAVRANGKAYPLAAGSVQALSMPVGRPVPIEWEAEEAGYLEGGRDIGPFEWNGRYRETIVPERRTPPSLRVRNVTLRRGMVVTVTRASDGSVVEEFTLEKGGEWTVELPEAGRYRVQTKANPDKRNDLEQNPAGYDTMDETVECAWGKPVVLDCSADLKRNPGQGVPAPDQGDWVQDALVSGLNAAKARVEEEWGEHSTQATIWTIDRALQKAANFARFVDADGIAGQDIPWTGWASAVEAKRGVRNADWQRIVEATAASGSWTEFFSRFSGREPHGY